MRGWCASKLFQGALAVPQGTPGELARKLVRGESDNLCCFFFSHQIPNIPER